MENNGKMRTSAEPNKIYIVGKVFMKAIQKCSFYLILATVSKVMGIYVKFTATNHQIWSRDLTPGFKFRRFLFLHNDYVLGKVTKFGLNWLKNKKVVKAKNKLGGGWGWKHPLCLRVKIARYELLGLILISIWLHSGKGVGGCFAAFQIQSTTSVSSVNLWRDD